jgi:D-xylose transport system permease protein
MSTEVTSTTTTTAAPVPQPTSLTPWAALGERFRRGDLGQLPAVLMLVVIAIFFQITSQGFFFFPRNLSNLMLQIATTACLSLGAVLVLLLGEIDLSMAAVANFCGAVMVTLSVYHGFGALPALLAGLVAGAIIGLINGFVVAVLRVPSFVVTLAGYIFYSGLLLHILLPNTTIRLIDPTLTGIMTNYVTFPWDVLIPIPVLAIFVGLLLYTRAQRRRANLALSPIWDVWGRIGLAILLFAGGLFIFESAFGVPYSTFLLVGLILLLWIMLRFTRFGRHIYAVGGNAEAARRAGINVIWIRIAVFTLTSTLAALGGILDSSRAISATAQVDPALLLNAIAVAVIGGVSLFGGRGSIWGVVLGALVIGSLSNGLDLLSSQNADIKLMVEGVVLLIAVIIDALARRRNAVQGR